MTVDAATALAERDDSVEPRSPARLVGRIAIYTLLIIWTFIALFPIYWTLSTSVKLGRDVTQGHLIPWVDFMPAWKGWQSLGLSPDTIFATSNVREEFLKKFVNSVICSVGASFFAIVIGSLAAYGLSRFDYKFGPWRNKDISFFFVSQLILPPVVLALPFLVLYKGLALLDTRIGLIFIYTLMVLPIVIWVMRDQFDTIPMEMEQAALVDGCTIWGAFLRIVLPIALPGMVAAFILSLVLCWNEYFFASLLTGFDAQTLPVMVASQTGSSGINWWTIAALATAAITPLLLDRHFPRTLHRHGADRGSGQIAGAPVSGAGPSRERLRALTMELMLIPGLSGHEGRVRRRLAAEMAGLGLATTTDRLGNLIATAEGDPSRPSVMLFAHMDQLGFVVRKIEASGFLRLERLGGVPERALAAQELLICVGEGRDIRALIGNKSHHATSPEDKYRVVPYQEILVDAGFSSAEAAVSAGVKIGSPVVYAPKAFMLEGNRIAGTSVDDRAGCAVVAEVARLLAPIRQRPTIHFVFSTQEEYNLRGAMPAAQALKPDIAIQLDLMLATDTPDMQARGAPIVLILNIYDLYYSHTGEGVPGDADGTGIGLLRPDGPDPDVRGDRR